MKAEIICVGTELLLGNIINTNAKFLSRRLADIGIDVYYQTVVGDNQKRILETTLNALKRADILLFSGGLGPTEDDCTKEVVCKAINRELYLDKQILENINCFFEQRQFPKSNKKQAYVPVNSKVLKNDIGTAPGFYIEEGNKTIILLPGPPTELTLMFDKYVIPKLNFISNFTIKSRVIKTIGIGESSLEEKIIDLIDSQSNPTIATYANNGQVDIRITAKADNADKADVLLNEIEHELDLRIKDYIYSYENESIEEKVFKMLYERKLKIGFCESCTAGLTTSMLASVPGASEVLERSYITYSNLSKIDEVSVRESTLNKYGAVSKETATEMAKGLLKKCSIDIGVSITGIAGPTGGTKNKPVGLVYICLATKDKSFVLEKKFHGNREENRVRSAKAAFNLVRKYLLNLI
ncbi:competence/damage-inducible protein A [Proteiniborus sp.]|uniref:competence/damage-inducible protein A n=1 Tax=Proteiniborus sp. TaxID=2079015 RepID=UPI003318A355